MSVNKILDWQVTYWNTLLGRPDSLPHAMLLVGPAGIGKAWFAETMAARLLCEKATGADPACGDCPACHWLAGGNHPDYRKVTLEDEADPDDAEAPVAKTKKKTSAPTTQIKIHQIRALEDFVFVGSHRQGRRVIIIEPADAMNVAAANSLLKMLEEPPLSVYFILISSKQKRLLPTLRSRCRQIHFGIPETLAAANWLKEQGVAKPEDALGLSGGAPLKALEAAKENGTAVFDDVLSRLLQPAQSPPDPLALAAHWESIRRKSPAFLLEHLVDTVQKWLYDVARVGQGAAPRYLVGRQEELLQMSARTAPARLNRLYRDLLKVRATARHPLNELLFLEDLAARCYSVLSTPRH